MYELQQNYIHSSAYIHVLAISSSLAFKNINMKAKSREHFIHNCLKTVHLGIL